MAPEQAAARRDVGPAADIYALGVILFEMLTGRRPFEGEHALTVMDGVLRDPPSPPRRLRPDVPRDLDVVCLKCLEKEPDKRYATAAELADDLARFLADEPIRARPQGPVEKAARWCRRKPLLAGLTAALVAVFLLGFAGVTGLWLVADDRGRLAEEKGRLAEENERLAVEKATEARTALDGEAQARADGQLHIARLDGVTAGQLVEDGDLIAALPWLAEAMQLEEQGYASRPAERAARERVNRARLAAVLRLCPWPLHVWTYDRGLKAAFFSPDGAQVITATNPGPVRVWDTATGAMIRTLPGGASEQTKTALTAGGLLAVGGPKDTDVILVDTTTGAQVGEGFVFPAAVRQVALSPDGGRLVASCGDKVRMWEVSPRRILWDVHPQRGDTGDVAGVAFVTRGRRVLIAPSAAAPEIRDAETGDVVTRLDGPTGTTATLGCSPDGRLLVTGGPDGARLWDAESGAPRHVLVHGAGVWHAAFSPDGRLLATGGGDGTARVWEIGKSQGPVAIFRHAARVVRVSFSPDGRRLLTASHDGTARVWEATTGRPLVPPLRHTRPLVTAAFHPDGDRVLTAADHGFAHLWDVTVASQPATPLWHGSPVRHAAFHLDGKRVATVADNGSVRVWGSDGVPATPWMLQPERLTHVGFHPGGRELVTGGFRVPPGTPVGVVQTWDLDRAAPGGLRLSIGAGKVSRVGFSPDGSRVLLVGPFAANVWDVARRMDVASVNHGNLLRFAAFSPDGARVAVGTHVGFGAAEVHGRNQYRVYHSDVGHLAFSPDGRRLAVAGDAHTAGVFDAATGDPLTPPLGHDGPVRMVAFGPDGRVLATAADDRTARLWDTATGKPLTPPLHHRGPVLAVAFSPDGSAVLTACNVATDRGAEGRLRWWDLATGEPLTPPLVHPGAVYHAAVSPRGGLAVAACEAGGAYLWPVPPPDPRPTDDLRRLAEVLSGQRLDPRLGPLPISHEEFAANWNHLRARYPDDFRRSMDRAAWHRAEAASCEEAGDWPAAAWHLDRLLKSRPSDGELVARRGHLFHAAGDPVEAAKWLDRAAALGPADAVRAGVRERADRYTAARNWPATLWYLDRLVADNPEEAALFVQRAGVHAQRGDSAKQAVDLAKAVDKGADGATAVRLATLRAAGGQWVDAARLLATAADRGKAQWVAHATVCLKVGDRAAYRRVCESALDRAANGRFGPGDANEVAWACALAPGAAVDSGRAVVLAERALAEVQSEGRPGCLNTLGAVLYRAGRHRDAIARLREGMAAASSEGTEHDWVFLALAHHALGEPEEARRWAERARAARQPAGGPFSWERVGFELLGDELEAAVSPRPRK
jgi:WD40 repeat protein/tetratricopeptide (TPR) repeat protein